MAWSRSCIEDLNRQVFEISDQRKPVPIVLFETFPLKIEKLALSPPPFFGGASDSASAQKLSLESLYFPNGIKNTSYFYQIHMEDFSLSQRYTRESVLQNIEIHFQDVDIFTKRFQNRIFVVSLDKTELLDGGFDLGKKLFPENLYWSEKYETFLDTLDLATYRETLVWNYFAPGRGYKASLRLVYTFNKLLVQQLDYLCDFSTSELCFSL